MREALTSTQAPDSFGYRITEVTGPMKALIREIDGKCSFAADRVGSGSTVSWSWDITPTSLGKSVMPVFGRLSKGYAAKAQARIDPPYRQSQTGGQQ